MAIDFVGSIARLLRDLPDQIIRRVLKIVRPSHLSEQIQTFGGEIDLAKFGRPIIPWERVMVVVPTFSDGQNGDA